MPISFDLPPINGEAAHQLIDQLIGALGGMGGEVGVLGGGQNAAVAQDLLDLQQVKAGLDQVGGIAVATGITTLLINRRPFKFTIDITPTLARWSTLFDVCDDKAMKCSS
jgi:hypothetical protein